MCVFLAHVVGLWRLLAIDWVERGLSDVRALATSATQPHEDIVILNVDERSLARLGRWPWSREVMAGLVDRLFSKPESSVKVLGLDMLLAEPDRIEGADAKLTQAMEGRPVVLGWYLSNDPNAQESGVVPDASFLVADLPVPDPNLPSWLGHAANLDTLQTAAAGNGLFNPIIDADGKLRSVPLLSAYQGGLHDSLAFALWRQTLPPHTLRFVPSPDGNSHHPIERLQVKWFDKLIDIPLNTGLTLFVPWRGHGGAKGNAFRYLSLADLWDGKVPSESLKNKIAIWGSTAPGLNDLRATPVNPAFPGVEIHALALAALLDQQFVSIPSFSLGWEVLALLVLGAVAQWALLGLSPAKAMAVCSLLIGTFLGLAQWAYVSQHWLLPIASPLLFMLVLFSLHMAWGYWGEDRHKRQFAALFGQYVPPELVQKMAQDPTRYSMQPQAAELTILFSDVRGFTSISEQLSPDDLRSYINQYLSAMSQCVAKHQGTLDKYIGDAVMAFFGAPVAQDDHAHRAVRTAWDMLAAARTLNDTFEELNWPSLKIGIGLNTGQVRVGDMGSDVRRAYTVMGDPVNLSSRLEGRTKYYGVGLLVGPLTMAQTPQMLWRELDRIRVKGKTEPTRIFTPVIWQEEAQAHHMQAHRVWENMLSHYRQREWDMAHACLQQLRRLDASDPTWFALYQLYEDRIHKLGQQTLPDDWQGVTDFDEK